MKKISDNSMWRGASATIFSKAAKLRHEMTQSETLLWNRLRANQLLGYKFRRQHPISIYIDFLPPFRVGVSKKIIVLNKPV